MTARKVVPVERELLMKACEGVRRAVVNGVLDSRSMAADACLIIEARLKDAPPETAAADSPQVPTLPLTREQIEPLRQALELDPRFDDDGDKLCDQALAAIDLKRDLAAARAENAELKEKLQNCQLDLSAEKQAVLCAQEELKQFKAENGIFGAGS